MCSGCILGMASCDMVWGRVWVCGPPWLPQTPAFPGGTELTLTISHHPSGTPSPLPQWGGVPCLVPNPHVPPQSPSLLSPPAGYIPMNQPGLGSRQVPGWVGRGKRRVRGLGSGARGVYGCWSSEGKAMALRGGVVVDLPPQPHQSLPCPTGHWDASTAPQPPGICGADGVGVIGGSGHGLRAGPG